MPSGLAMLHPNVHAHINKETFNTQFNSSQLYDVCVWRFDERAFKHSNVQLMGSVHLRRSARHLAAVGDWLRCHVYCGENRARLGTFVSAEVLK